MRVELEGLERQLLDRHGDTALVGMEEVPVVEVEPDQPHRGGEDHQCDEPETQPTWGAGRATHGREDNCVGLYGSPRGCKFTTEGTECLGGPWPWW